MLRRLVTLSVAGAVLLTAGVASAQAAPAFGEQGQAIVSVDRLMPLLSYDSYNIEDTVRGSTTQSQTSLSFVGHGLSLFDYGGGTNAPLFYDIPRFAFDYTVWQHLTVGGSIWAYFQLGNSTTQHQPGQPDVSADNGKVTFWGLAPRVGWILHLSDLFAFWPRGGISFNDASVSFPARMGGASTSATVTQWALNLEPMFALTPLPHAAITAGPVVDIPFAGSISQSANGVSISVGSTQFHFGLTAGLLVWF
jgi:hypothetical protein